MGQITGYYSTSSTGGHGFVLTGKDLDDDGLAEIWFEDNDEDGVNDLVTELGQAQDSTEVLRSLRPTKINDKGQITGYLFGRSEPFLITPKRSSDGGLIYSVDENGDGANDLVTKLPLLSVGQLGQALGMNEAGMVTGWADTARGERHAVIWRPDAQGRMVVTDLGIFGNVNRTYGLSVNNTTQVVGYGDQYSSGRVRSKSAFLWQGGVMKDLRTILDQGAALTGVNMQALQISSSGIILGIAGDPFIAVPLKN